MRQTITLTYLGVVTGFLALLVLNCSVWLEMRINTSLVLPIITLAGFVLSFFFRRKVPLPAGLALQVTVILLFLVRYGFEAGVLSVMPAVLLREGFHLGFLDARSVNILLVAMIFIGNLSAQGRMMHFPAKSPGWRKNTGSHLRSS